MMYWSDGGWSWWWMLPMMFFMVLLIGALIWGLVALTRSAGTPAPSARSQPEDILDERFARGEIDVTEYTDRVNSLRGTHPTSKR
jgi:putative membrane protein